VGRNLDLKMQLGISTYMYGQAVGISGNKPEQPTTATKLLTKAKAFELKLVQFGYKALDLRWLRFGYLDKASS